MESSQPQRSAANSTMGMDIFKLFVFEAKIVTLLAHTGGGYENQNLNCLPELTFEIFARCMHCPHHCLLPQKMDTFLATF